MRQQFSISLLDGVANGRVEVSTDHFKLVAIPQALLKKSFALPSLHKEVYVILNSQDNLTLKFAKEPYAYLTQMDFDVVYVIDVPDNTVVSDYFLGSNTEFRGDLLDTALAMLGAIKGMNLPDIDIEDLTKNSDVESVVSNSEEVPVEKASDEPNSEDVVEIAPVESSVTVADEVVPEEEHVEDIVSESNTETECSKSEDVTNISEDVEEEDTSVNEDEVSAEEVSENKDSEEEFEFNFAEDSGVSGDIYNVNLSDISDQGDYPDLDKLFTGDVSLDYSSDDEDDFDEKTLVSLVQDETSLDDGEDDDYCFSFNTMNGVEAPTVEEVPKPAQELESDYLTGNTATRPVVVEEIYSDIDSVEDYSTEHVIDFDEDDDDGLSFGGNSFTDVFEGVLNPTIEDYPYHIISKGIYAEGKVTEDGFLVYKNSGYVLTPVASCPPRIVELRQQIERTNFADGKAKSDILFPDPLTAASVLLGVQANNTTGWQTSDGRSLAEVKNNTTVPTEETVKNSTVYRYTNNDNNIDSKLYIDPDKKHFWLLKGSRIALEVGANASEYLKKQRYAYRHVIDANGYLTMSIRFTTASGATSFAVGKNANTKVWKTTNGMRLD